MAELSAEWQIALRLAHTQFIGDSWGELKVLLLVLGQEVGDAFLELLEDLLISVILTLLDVVESHALLIHDLHVEVGWVAVQSYGKTNVSEVEWRLLAAALINDVPLDHNDQPIELAEYLRAGLVNGRYNGSPILRQFVQKTDHV